MCATGCNVAFVLAAFCNALGLLYMSNTAAVVIMSCIALLLCVTQPMMTICDVQLMTGRTVDGVGFPLSIEVSRQQLKQCSTTDETGLNYLFAYSIDLFLKIIRAVKLTH